MEIIVYYYLTRIATRDSLVPSMLGYCSLASAGGAKPNCYNVFNDCKTKPAIFSLL